jgi:hypothetical protein
VPKRGTIEAVAADPAAHPAARAWGEFRGAPADPARIAVLKETGKSGVYRLQGVGPGGTAVIAKRCRREHLRAERIVYKLVLPHLGVTAPICHGFLEAGEFSWLFLGDVGDEPCNPERPEHHLLAARWLGRLHATAPGLPALARLPDRGPRHYLEHLQSARRAIRGSWANPALTADDRSVLAAVLSRLDQVEARWGPVEAFCATMPQTLVHGDFVPKNLRLRAGPGGTAVLPLDWETAGRGVPAADLAWFVKHPAEESFAAYGLIVREAWRHVGYEEVRRLARVGYVFRLLAAVSWSSVGLTGDWLEKPLRHLRSYQAYLTEALQPAGWEG